MNVRCQSCGIHLAVPPERIAGLQLFACPNCKATFSVPAEATPTVRAESLALSVPQVPTAPPAGSTPKPEPDIQQGGDLPSPLPASRLSVKAVGATFLVAVMVV